MLIHCGNRKNIFRIVGIGLIVGSALVTSATVALAQDQNQNAAQQSQRPDAAIQSDVTSALAQDSSLHGVQVHVSAASGVITLNGTVQTDAQRQQAETDAANVSGVSGIMNNLKVTQPGTSSAAAGVAAQDSANQLNTQNLEQNQSPSQAQDQQNQSQNQAQDQQNQGQNAVPPPPPDEPQRAPSYQTQQPPYQTQQPPPQQSYPRQPYQPYQPYQQGYAPAPQVPYYSTTSTPVTVPPGTLLRVRLSEPLDTEHIKSGAFFEATAAVDVYQNGVLAIPRGAALNGQVIEAKKAGDLGGSAVLKLQLTNINLGGKIFPVSTDVWSSKGPNKAGYSATNTAGGALVGALIGGIIGRGAGAAVGAGVGAAGGLAASAATGGPRIYLPAETTIDFHLADPATVQPVSWQEAQRLASSVPPQSPVLVRRPRPVYVVPGPYYYPYPYTYPYPY